MTLELMNLALDEQSLVVKKLAVTQISVFAYVIQQVEIILST